MDRLPAPARHKRFGRDRSILQRPAGKWLEYYSKVFDYVEVD